MARYGPSQQQVGKTDPPEKDEGPSVTFGKVAALGALRFVWQSFRCATCIGGATRAAFVECCKASWLRILQIRMSDLRRPCHGGHHVKVFAVQLGAVLGFTE